MASSHMRTYARKPSCDSNHSCGYDNSGDKAEARQVSEVADQMQRSITEMRVLSIVEVYISI